MSPEMRDGLWLVFGFLAMASLWKAAGALSEIQRQLGRLIEIFADSELGTRR